MEGGIGRGVCNRWVGCRGGSGGGGGRESVLVLGKGVIAGVECGHEGWGGQRGFGVHADDVDDGDNADNDDNADNADDANDPEDDYDADDDEDDQS